MKQFILGAHPEARRRAVEAVIDSPDGMVVTIKPKTRTLEQNSLMWTLLNEIAAQVIWHGQKLTSEEWKDMATAALKNQKVIPGIGGGFVVVGARTSKMTKSELSDLVEFLLSFGAEQNVVFKEL